MPSIGRYSRLAALLLLPFNALHAQAAALPVADLKPNERVSLFSRAQGLRASEPLFFVRASADSLWITRGHGDNTFGVPLNDLDALSVARGKRANGGAAVTGAVLGGAAGVIMGWATCFAITCKGGLDGGAFSARIMGGLLIGGATGFALGYGPHDIWVTVALPPHRK